MQIVLLGKEFPTYIHMYSIRLVAQEYSVRPVTSVSLGGLAVIVDDGFGI